MSTKKYKLKAKARVNGEWLDPGAEVELTPDQIKRLDEAAKQSQSKEAD